MSLVRAVHENGLEINISESVAKAAELKVLDEPTTNGDGTPRPQTRTKGRRLKPKTSVSAEAAKKNGGSSAPTAEEATE